MEASENYQFLKEKFDEYLSRVAPSLGIPEEEVALGFFIALLAVKLQGAELSISMQSPHRESYLREKVKAFEEIHLNQFEAEFERIYFIPYDEEILYEHFHYLSELKLDIEIELNDLFDSILENQSLRLQSGINNTPRGLSSLLAHTSGIKSGEVAFDPAMGSGHMLNILSQYEFQDIYFIGADQEVRNQILAKIKSILLSANTVKFHIGSAFDFKLKNMDAKFDVVISNPPFSKISKEDFSWRYQGLIPTPSNDLSLNFIELGLQSLKQTGSAAFLVNMSALFSAGDSRIVRDSWLQRKLIRAVISLPAGLLPYTGLKCALLLFGEIDIKKLPIDSVRLVKAEDCVTRGAKRKLQLSDSDVQDIANRLKFGEGKSRFIDISYAEIAKNGTNLDPSRYFEQQEFNSNKKLAKKWVKIEGIADVFSGAALANLPEGEQPIIQGRDIRVNTLDREKLQRKDLNKFTKKIKLTNKGDVLLQRIGSSPAAYLVKKEDEGLIVANTLFIIRFKNLPKDIIEFIVHYMNSNLVSKRLSNARSFSVVQTQTLSTIRGLEVPLPDKDVVETLQQLNSLELTLKDEYEKTIEYKESLFRGDDSNDLTNQIANARFAIETLTSALEKKDDINYLIADQYPFPISYSYRNIYAERDFASIYERQMKYGEQFLAFLVALGMSLVWKYFDQSNEIDKIKLLIEDFKDNVKTGLSPGHWQESLQKCCKILKNIDKDICQDFSSIWFRSAGKKESSFAQDTKSLLVTPLNDYKHHRGPANKHERKKKSNQQKMSLEKLLGDVDFLTKWDLILIDDLDKGWQSDNLEIAASLLRGDHPAFKSISFSSPETLSKNKLYIKYGQDCIPLYPMLSVIYNEETKREEIFGFDKRTNNGISLRSFDSGTSIENQVIARDFDQWIKKILEFQNLNSQ